MKVAFTSCMDATQVPVQPVWDEIKSQQPDVLMLLGDQIYMDWGLSSSNNPKWLKRIRKNGDSALEEFAREMHMRYAAQWEVSSFRDLIHWFVGTHGYDQLFMCWDDHDFAWNNSCGMGRPENAAVPARVKAISKCLFLQFREHLAKGHAISQYPDYPDAHKLALSPNESGIEYFSPTPIGSVRIAVLDQRWYHYPRQEVAENGEFPTHLGTSQWGQIERMMADSTGLNILAGGLPLQHKYRFSHQAWGAGTDGEPAYPDHDRLLRVVKKPTLYLGGDIHRNEVLGLLKSTSGEQNKHLLHLASSGAALPKVLWIKFEPSYGLLNIDVNTKTVHIQLRQFKADRWNDEFNQKLNYSDTGWQTLPGQVLPTEETQRATSQAAQDQITNLSNQEPDLSVLCARRMLKSAVGQATHAIEGIDAIYSDNDLSRMPGSEPGSAYPDAVVISPSRKQIYIAKTDPDLASTIAVFQSALDRAKDKGKKAITLFVHGFNNGFAQSIEQAYTLRSAFGSIEPVLLSWSGGEISPFLLDAGSDAKLALENAQHLPSTLVIALLALQNLQNVHTSVNRVLVMRSYGCAGLEALISGDVWTSNNNQRCIDGLNSIVLSAPAISIQNLGKWLPQLPIALNVIANRHDRTLEVGYKAIHKSWDALGCTTPPGYFDEDNHYFDCSDFEGVGNKHNIITTPEVSKHVSDLHELLLSGSFNANNPPTGFSKAINGQNVWTKS